MLGDNSLHSGTDRLSSIWSQFPTVAPEHLLPSKMVSWPIKSLYSFISLAPQPSSTSRSSSRPCPGSPTCSCSTRSTIVDHYPHTMPDEGMLASSAVVLELSYPQARKLSTMLSFPLTSLTSRTTPPNSGSYLGWS
jgi:hypothetical protein